MVAKSKKRKPREISPAIREELKKPAPPIPYVPLGPDDMTRTKVVLLQGRAKAIDTPMVRAMRDKLRTETKPTTLRYVPEVDPREEGYRIVSVQPIHKYAMTYWLNGVLEHRVVEATSSEEASLLLDREVEELNHG
jgi:hypothetical protein